MQSDMRRITDDPSASPVIEPVAAKFTRSVAVVIGINEYIDPIPPLTTPVNDAEAVAAVLARDQGYDVQLTLTQNVTRAKLVALFSETLCGLNLGKMDRLLVYFAGHGTTIQGEDGEPQYYLVPQDAVASDRSSLLPMQQVREELLRLECRHLMLVLDCCFAGAFGRMRAGNNSPHKIYLQRYNFYARSQAWQVLASAAYDETALDTAGGLVFGRHTAEGLSDHSPFALALLQGLRGDADTNQPARDGMPNGDGLITAMELASFVSNRVLEQAGQLNHPQTPALWPLLPKHQAGENVFQHPGRALALELAEDLTAERNPYLGLKSYEESHFDLFFGRGKQIRELEERVEKEPFVVVLGASGTGKSSLVKAGLLHVLKDDKKPTTAKPNSSSASFPSGPETRWFVLPPFRPAGDIVTANADPVRGLDTLLQKELPDTTQAGADFTADAHALANVVARFPETNAGVRLVLVVDQFEELVTLCEEPERRHLQELLVNALQAHPDTLRIIVTLRSDFEPLFARGPLQEFWQRDEARWIVPPMNQDDLRQVIVGPALKREMYFESTSLIDKLINEVIQTPGGLPLLSFTLSEMYLQYIESGRGDRTLREIEYAGVGGVIGSLRQAANRVYGELEPPEQSMMKRIMLRMIALEGGEVARRRVSNAELDYGTDENRLRDIVLKGLTQARLVVSGGDEDYAWKEPAHDALISGWDVLLGWKLRASSYLPLQRELAPAALKWQAASAGSKRSLLWNNNPQLPVLQDTLWPANTPDSKNQDGGNGVSGDSPTVSAQPKGTGKSVFRTLLADLLRPRLVLPDNPQWLNHPEAEFVTASVNRRSFELKRIGGIVLLVLVALTGLTVFASFNADEANRQRQTADANALLADEQRKAAVTSAAEATRQQGIAEKNAVVANQQKELAQEQARIANARRLAAESISNVDSQFDFALLVGMEASRGDDNVETRGNLLDLLTSHPQLVRYLHGHRDAVQTVAFSPDGETLVTGAHDGTLTLWNTNTAEMIAEVPGARSEIISVAFNPQDAKELLVTQAGLRFLILDTAGNQRAFLDLQGLDTVKSASYSPDGALIAGGNQDGHVRIWDAKTHQVVVDDIVVPGKRVGISQVLFSPDGKILAAARGGGGENDILLWQTDTWEPIGEPLQGHSRIVQRIAFATDSKLLASADGGGTILLLDVATRETVGELLDSGSVNDLVFIEGGTVLVSAGAGGTIRFWDVVKQRAIGDALTGHHDSVNSIAFSSDGTHFASGSRDNTAILWQLKPQLAIASTLASTQRLNLTFSPDGKTLAANDRNSIAVWKLGEDETDPSLNVLPIPQSYAMTFSSDNKRLAIIECGKSVDGEGCTQFKLEFFDVATLEPKSEPLLIDNPSPSYLPRANITFRNQDKTIVSAWCSDSRVGGECNQLEINVWDPAQGRSVRRPFRINVDGIFEVRFSPDQNRIAVAGCAWRSESGRCQAGGIYLWDLKTQQPIHNLLVGHLDAIRALAFDSKGELLASGSNDGTILVWNVQDGEPVGQPLRQHNDSIGGIGFVEDDNILVSSSMDNTILLWDVATGQTLGSPLQDIRNTASKAITVHPGGKSFVMGSRGTITFWDVALNSWKKVACSIANRNLTRAEWEQYIRINDETTFDDFRKTPTCKNLPVEQ